MESNMEFFKKEKEALYYSEISLLDIYKGNKVSLLKRHICSHVFCSTIHNIHDTNQPKCPLMDK
jgi:hypothetical protein